eukprot:1901840-Rhodomonas_salina.1
MGPLDGASRSTGGVPVGYLPEDEERDSASQDEAACNARNESDEEGYVTDYAGCEGCRILSLERGTRSVCSECSRHDDPALDLKLVRVRSCRMRREAAAWEADGKVALECAREFQRSWEKRKLAAIEERRIHDEKMERVRRQGPWTMNG